MELILWIVVVVMLPLLLYTVIWTSISINKKTQPFVDSFFDFVRRAVAYSRRRDVPRGNDRSGTLKPE